MDSLITAAARALATGDPLGALKRVALRSDASALALRGIAMAQLGDFPRARALMRSAARSFGAREVVARARCIVAEAEIALASRDLNWPVKALDAARQTLTTHGDAFNAAHASHLAIRRLALIGHLGEAASALATMDASSLPPALRAVHELIAAGVASRHLRISAAAAALVTARRAALQAGIPSLIAEIDSAHQVLRAPAARLIVRGESRLLRLDEVETLYASETLVVDASHREVRARSAVVSLAKRPILFALARELAQAWPKGTSRELLVTRAFDVRFIDETIRARLRVEIGRLRRALLGVADINATDDGFAIVPVAARDVVVLTLPVEDEHAPVLAFLADGESWSSSALAIALGTSQRTVQRSLDALAMSGRIQSFGKGRARRWLTPPLPGFTTTLLLTAPLPGQ